MTHPIKSIAIGLASALLLSACMQEQASEDQSVKDVGPRPAKIVVLTKIGSSFTRTYPGTIEASEKADLAFRVGGQLSELPAEAGMRVKKGDLLARIDPKDYKNALDERKARLELARSQIKQIRTLRKKNLSSQAALNEATAELKAAQAAVEQASDNLRYTSLKAPFDGLVARVAIENHQPVQAQAPIIHLRTEENLSIDFNVPESLLSRLKRVDDLSILDNFCGQVTFVTQPGKSYRACHKEHETIPDPLTRTYSALFELDPIGDSVILPGMSATIELDFSPFLAQQTKETVYAPVEAVFAEDGKQWVWRVDSFKQARRTEVTVGRIEGDRIEITNDIDHNTKVIAAGVSFVREGMSVKPMVKQRGL